MKVNVEIDCTPLEARQFFGLPDVTPMQTAMMDKLQQQMTSNIDKITPDALMQSWFSFDSQKQLPVEPAKDQSTEGQRRPIRQQQYDISGAASRFVVEDKNAATHLVRNAMGGKDKDMVCALLTLPAPYSRRYRYISSHSFILNDLLTTSF